MGCATANDWVVFASDETFQMTPTPETPTPTASVLDALRSITAGYNEYSEIREYVPGGWE